MAMSTPYGATGDSCVDMGASPAWELLRDAHRVIAVVDREDDPRAAFSLWGGGSVRSVVRLPTTIFD